MSGIPVVPYDVAIFLTLLVGIVSGGVLVWWILRHLWWEPLAQVGRQLESQLQRTQTENKGLRGRLRRAAQQYTREMRQHQQTTAEKTAVQIQLAQLEGRTRELAVRLEETNGRWAASQRALHESQDKLTELHTQRAGAMAKHEAQITLIAQLQQERQMWQAEVTHTRQTLAEAHQALGRLHALTAEKLALQTELEQVRQQLHQRQADHEPLIQQLAALSQQAGAWQAELTAAHSHLADYQRTQHALAHAEAQILALEQAIAQHKRDNLQEIDGIGPVFAKRLYEAGIDSFAKLAQTSAERLREVVQLKPWQAADIEGWREQAEAWSRR